MGIKDILAKAKQVQHKTAATINATQSRVAEHRAREQSKRAEREAKEAKALDARLERLQSQERKLRRKDAAQSSIRAKQKRIADLEARVTTKGKILKKLNEGATKLLKQATKNPRRAKKRKRGRG